MSALKQGYISKIYNIIIVIFTSILLYLPVYQLCELTALSNKGAYSGICQGRGGLKLEHSRSWYEFSDDPVSKIDIKLCQSYTKTYRFAAITYKFKILSESENYDNSEKLEWLRLAPVIIWI